MNTTAFFWDAGIGSGCSTSASLGTEGALLNRTENEDTHHLVRKLLGVLISALIITVGEGTNFSRLIVIVNEKYGSYVFRDLDYRIKGVIWNP